MTDMDYTPARGRRFGFTLAIAFGILAAIASWRERETRATVLGAIAIAFLFAGLLFPGKLHGVERAWMKLAHAISRVTTPLFMAIVYFVVLTPVGVVRRIAAANPLVHRADNGSFWIRRPAMEDEKARLRMKRQF